jgi:hypothetical protein
MNKNRYINRISAGFTFGLLLFTLSLNAQVDTNTPATIEKMKTIGQWHQSSNAAGLMLDNFKRYTELNFSYMFYNGNFKFPQEGESGNSLNFHTEGNFLLGKGYLWGRFDYARDMIKNANHNASIIDPFRGMPYYYADLNESNWVKQDYFLQAKGATAKLLNVLSFGFDLSYNSQLAAKQRDPRTENRYYTIAFKPSMLFSANHHHIGLNFDYYNIKEEGRSALVTWGDYHYFYTYGLGKAIEYVDKGTDGDYYGNNFGGGIQYSFTGAFKVFVSGNYSMKVENHDWNSNNRVNQIPNGAVKDQVIAGKLAIGKECQMFTHNVELNYVDRKISGIEYITERDIEASTGFVVLWSGIRSKFNTQRFSGRYDIFRTSGREYSWKAGIEGLYEKIDDVYLIPRSVKNAENLTFNLDIKKNFNVSDQLVKRLLFEVRGGLNKNLSGEYVYGGQNPQFETVTMLEQGNINYLTSNYVKFGGAIKYSQLISNRSNANLFFGIDANYYTTKSDHFSNRTFVRLSVGCNF